jgi:uncharacterized protein YdhG (YjbR/CyaY superfamily)
MAWVKVPPENHPIFYAALPKDERVETMKMFGGVAAKVNGHLFAGLFGRSTMLLLAEPDRAAALALDGASFFDPMGDGRARSDKVMLPESTMTDPAALRGWLARAFKAASVLPKKDAKSAPARKTDKKMPAKKASVAKIDDYLATITGDNRAALDQLRKMIRSIVPRAEECISYGMPAFRLDGRVIAGFQATAKGCSYYPFSGTTLQTLAGHLQGYGKTKSALHFRPDKPLPASLVRKLIKARIAETR